MDRIPRASFVASTLRRISSAKREVAGLALTLLLAGCAIGDRELYYPSAADYQIHGIDVSKYQGDIDWSAVRDAGVKFVWIKATEGGDYVDDKFAQNWAAAKAAGIPHGAYHFMYWCRPPEEQAQWFIEHVPRDPDALPPVLDVEWTPLSKTCPRHVPRAVALADMKVILDAMQQAYGKRSVIYTSVDFYRDVLEGQLTNYQLWVRSVKYFPSVKYGARRWHFWQHSEHAHIPGIRGNVDENAFNGSPSDWRKYLALASN